jgi:hypothetical protein
MPTLTYAASSPEARAIVDVHIRKLVPEFIEYTFTKSAPYRNHWVGGGRVGTYGADYRLRTVANYAGIWANTSDEVIYFVATRDADERTLNGSNSYVIHFPADKLPESVIDAFWSVILVGVPDYRVVPNPLNRFNINNFSPLRKETDGSLKLAIGPKPIPGVAQSNWLPSPEGKPFSPPPVDRARSVLRRIDGRAHGVHHLWQRGRLLRSGLTPWSGSHDAEPRSRMCLSGFDYHGLACLRPAT